MKRETLQGAIDQGAVLLAQLEVLRSIDATLRRHFIEPAAAAPADPLLAAILGFTGSLAAFTAGELLATADAPLRAALEGRDAHELGRALADLDGAVVFGRRLTFKGRNSEGNSWAFEPV